MKSIWLALAVLVCLALVFGASVPLQAAPPQPQALPGHVLRALATSGDLGALRPDQSLTLTVALKPRSEQAFRTAAGQATLAARSGQPSLSAADVGRLYGQSDATIQNLSGYFAGFGLQVLPLPPDRLSFRVSGTVAQVQASLGVQLHRYQDPQGHAFFATDRDPQLPSAFAGTVQAIFGLDNYPSLQRLHSTGSAPTPGDYVPNDMQTAYNVAPLYAQGWTGAGQTIGAIGCDAFVASDIQTFRQQFGLPSATVTTIAVDGGADGSDVETTLDLEWGGAIATGANLRYYGFASSSGGCPFQGFLDAVTQAVTDNVASVLSISLGACESTYNSSGFLTAMETEFAAAALQHQGVFVASGDSGAFACGGSTPAVSYPASSAFVTAVGGTSLKLNADSTYQSETAWGSSTECGGPCGTGGGKSTVIAEPSWQQGAGLPNSGGKRAVPDVALDADPATGNVVYFTLNSSLGCTGFCGGIGGTSIATPEWAGLAAIANQMAGQSLGQLAPLLYAKPVQTAQSSANPPFHDVISGNNLFYQAKAGWDFPTGWGSPNAATLIDLLAFPSGTPTPTSTTTSTPTPSTTATASVTSTSTLTSTPSATATTTATASPTGTTTPSLTASPTDTATTTPTTSAASTPSATLTATPTGTTTAAPTTSLTSTVSAAATSSPIGTGTDTPVATATPSETGSPTVSPTSSSLPSITSTLTASSTPTPSATSTPMPTVSLTPTGSPTDSATASPTVSPDPSSTGTTPTNRIYLPVVIKVAGE